MELVTTCVHVPPHLEAPTAHYVSCHNAQSLVHIQERYRKFCNFESVCMSSELIHRPANYPRCYIFITQPP